MHIVVVEDNEVLAKSIVQVLLQEGYTTTHFVDGREASTWLLGYRKAYDLILLDVLLPGMDGIAICTLVRKEGVTEPILMLTSKDTLEDTVSGFAGGADDYLKKPFAFEELLARISALLRRPPLVTQDSVYITPDVRVDISERRIFKEGVEVHLTAKEFSILVYFIRHQKTPINQQALYDHVFDFAEVQLSNTVEVHIKNIRKKLRTKKYEIPLSTIRGAGYCFEIK